MNPIVVITIIIVMILVIILVILLVRAAVAARQTRETGSNNTTNRPACGSVVNTKDLLVIPDDMEPCHQDRVITLYYIGDLSQGKLDFVVAPITTSPTNVCDSFCTSLQNGVCTGPNYAGKTAQENRADCMTTLTAGTENCVPPMPLAIQGRTLYYPYSPTCRACDVCQQSD